MIYENDLRKHVNKKHPTGGAIDRNQVRIITFTTHSYKEKVFLEHKQNKKNGNGKNKKNPKHKPQVWLNIEPFLSCNTQVLAHS